MTDWLPWGGVLMVGLFLVLGLLLRSLAQLPQPPRLRPVWWAYWATVVLSLAAYSMYLLTGEGWIWYL